MKQPINKNVTNKKGAPNLGLSYNQLDCLMSFPECDVPVLVPFPGIVLFFDGIGTGIGKYLVPTKISESVSKKFGTKKVSESVSKKFGTGKKSRNRYW